ncbi:hypothetical protein CLV30_1216 [Haloactinopolyspora alba]|uniref:MOSC domain-containing protein n=1 Tax=Haloactinopolyspora alba TaxID=648780 RepID=A0A2P8DKV3_9ACTN|nr:MOSC N-terminal beta barrel domain-containing protein [Haloactinopolyspora alba]PSK97850.1 hypothetical protein CLV30_1216 [Haloactinopolyspora alba]
MRVVRIATTPVKGMAHVPRRDVALTVDGVPDDRVFCLFETATGRVARTAENPALLACRADWAPPSLTVHTPIGTVTGGVAEAGPVTGDYWGRRVGLNVVDGPWSALLSRYLGREVRLCRRREPGAVIWAGPVSLVTTSSLAELARRTGAPDEDGARFRPTLVVDTPGRPPFCEDAWVGVQLRVGPAVVTVRGALPRCAVVDREPGAGCRDHRVLAALAADRTRAGEIAFGVQGDVVNAGRVTVGAEVALAQPSDTSWMPARPAST